MNLGTILRNSTLALVPLLSFLYVAQSLYRLTTRTVYRSQHVPICPTLPTHDEDT
jgi:hypothetical protein